ncbi:MAG: hypothetical protein COV67_03320 [Nitrospinae bacterium CG11_big_fil_rev_8_21_14_0_20_56_8]|nr:MAG: hypothetical protein COV67_03320 [Nitrospinae bacterium CG11_big_fil_rev_8_21_14_0_20_56_8]
MGSGYAADSRVLKGHNFRILDVEGFDRVVFGCPPGLVKELGERKEELPGKYVIPIRTFVKGRNNFDFEFIIYSFLFYKARNAKIDIYCSRPQMERFKTILNETLFGPTFTHLLQAQLRKLTDKHSVNTKESGQFDAWFGKIASDRKLFDLFNNLLKEHREDREIQIAIKRYFSDHVRKPAWLVKKKIARLDSILTSNYIICAQLKKEMDLFALVDDKGREGFINSIVRFHIFGNNGIVYIQGTRDRRRKLKVSQVQPSVFDIEVKNRKLCHIDMVRPDRGREPADIQPITKPYMGVTFMGVGSGFSPGRRNSCLVAWTEGRGIMVDAFSEVNQMAMKYGISENDILYLFLTHVHSDHDAGLVEQVLSGQRIKMISSRIIFESFLRKMEAIICFPREVIEGFIDFIEVEPKKCIKLPGLKNSYFTFDYSLHSIPSGRFTLSYADPKGKEKVISHSGDTKYNVEQINAWYEQGVFPKSRRDSLLGFIWNADLVIHDVGGGLLHTDVDALDHFDDEVAKRMVLVHQHYDPKPDSRYTFAYEGQTVTLIERRSLPRVGKVAKIRPMALFQQLKEGELMKILKNSQVLQYPAGEIVFSQNEVGEDFFVILEGFAEIIIDGETFATYERGKFFGELAITTSNPLRRATVKARSALTVLKIPKRFYKKFHLPNIQDGYYQIRNHFNDFMNPSLIASLAFGKIVHWKKNESIISLGEGNKDMYIILSGQVEVQDKRRKTIAHLTNGDIVGELAGLKSLPALADAKASTSDVYAIHLNRKEMKRVFKLFPSFYATVCQKIKKLESTLS